MATIDLDNLKSSSRQETVFSPHIFLKNQDDNCEKPYAATIRKTINKSLFRNQTYDLQVAPLLNQMIDDASSDRSEN